MKHTPPPRRTAAPSASARRLPCLPAKWRPSFAVALALVATGASAAGFRASPVADFREGDFSFGLSAGTSFVGGKAREHVFAPKAMAAEYAAELGVPYANRRRQISRLDWDLAATMLGVSGSARYDRLSLNFGVWYGGSGSDDYDMKDYDWMNGDHLPHSEYSRSDTELTDAWMFDANLSCDFWRGEAFTGSVFAGAREQRWKWTCDGRNDYWYSENGHVWQHDRGHVCDYRQVIFFGYVGLGGTWKLSDAFDLSAHFSWGPGWKGRDRDNHIAAGKYCRESFDLDGNVYGAGVSLDWRVCERTTLSFAVDWQKATLNQGDGVQYDFDEDEETVLKDGAGMENEYAALTIRVAHSF